MSCRESIPWSCGAFFTMGAIQHKNVLLKVQVTLIIFPIGVFENIGSLKVNMILGTLNLFFSPEILFLLGFAFFEKPIIGLHGWFLVRALS